MHTPKPTHNHSTPDRAQKPCWECVHEGAHPKGWGPVCWHGGQMTVMGERRYGCAHWEPLPWPPMPGNGAAGD
jgi:hypothetical protein